MSFDIDHEGRDSHSFRKAGARSVALASPRRWAVMTELRGAAEPTLDEIAAHMEPYDLLLVEGWKRGPFPKIEARSARSLTREPLAMDDPNIVAVAADLDTDPGGLPVFALDDIAGIADFIATRLGLRSSRNV